MSVVQVKGRTTKIETEFDSLSLSVNSLILTDAEDSNVEEFSLELSVGDGWSDSYSISNRSLWKIDEGITVRGRDSIVVEAREFIRVPHNRYGVVLPTGSLFLSRGILVASAKVEPAFMGKLKLRIFNTTNKSVYLKSGEKLGSVVFFSTESTQRHNVISRAGEISTVPVSRMTKLKKWLSLNRNLWIGWIVSILSSSVVSFVLSYFFYYKPMLEKTSDHSAISTQVAPVKNSEASHK